MKIAILGWGSLITERGELPVTGDWQTGGPVIPIEFSRISQRGVRAGCLTLVIDPINGAPVSTQFITSSRNVLDESIIDLGKRERSNQSRIGFINLRTDTVQTWAHTQHPSACQTIRRWAIQQGFDAIVWTALTSNFEEVYKQPFSVATALEYLKNLDPKTRASAVEYIRRTPETTQTPFRTEATCLF